MERIAKFWFVLNLYSDAGVEPHAQFDEHITLAKWLILNQFQIAQYKICVKLRMCSRVAFPYELRSIQNFGKYVFVWFVVDDA